jgi:molybdopterin/thiamine biosynthesis adenylyltransferase
MYHRHQSRFVELSNLNRLVGATRRDALEKRPKVQVLARLAAGINPDLKVIPIQKSVLDAGVLDNLKGCDVVFGCTDNQGSRWILNKFAVEHLVPYFDTGTGIQADSNHNIAHAGGQVRVVVPGLGCLNCIQGLGVDIAQQELLPEPDRRVAEHLGYIAGADVKAPAVASLNGVIASLAVTEFMALATGFKPLRRFVGYDYMKATVTPYVFPRDPNCFTCSPTGSLAAGDEGLPLPVNLLIDDPQPQEQGESPMETQATNVSNAITNLLAHAEQVGLAMEGDAASRWFLIRDAKLGRPFNRPAGHVMVKFFGQTGDPAILLPEGIQINGDSPVCPKFLAATPCLKGWKALCPHMFHDVGEELLLFITCLCGFLANPSLCGCMGCPGKDDGTAQARYPPSGRTNPKENMMGLLPSVLGSVAHLAVTALDVVCFFILVRLLACRLSFPGLAAFASAGRPLVNWFVTQLERGLKPISARRPSEQTLLALGLLAAATIRFFLAALAAVMSTV